MTSRELAVAVDEALVLRPPVRVVCFDWGGTLMADDGPDDVPMCEWPAVEVIPDARGCLEALDGLVDVCVATNASASSRSMIERALERVDLLRFISRVFCVADIGCRKSHPEFWRTVESSLGVPLDQVVMIGDSLEGDVVAPARSGVQSIWFNRDGRAPAPTPPVATVTRLADVPGPVIATCRPRRARRA